MFLILKTTDWKGVTMFEKEAETCFYDDINDEEICKQEVHAWKEIILTKEI